MVLFYHLALLFPAKRLFLPLNLLLIHHYCQFAKQHCIRFALRTANTNAERSRYVLCARESTGGAKKTKLYRTTSQLLLLRDSFYERSFVFLKTRLNVVNVMQNRLNKAAFTVLQLKKISQIRHHRSETGYGSANAAFENQSDRAEKRRKKHARPTTNIFCLEKTPGGGKAGEGARGGMVAGGKVGSPLRLSATFSSL